MFQEDGMCQNRLICLEQGIFNMTGFIVTLFNLLTAFKKQTP